MLLKFRSQASLLTLLMLAVAPGIALGQAAATASILGKVTDQSGGILPGVTITVTSPALQVPQVAEVTDDEGNYQLRDLPAPGVYRVSFELAGFQTVVRESLNLSAGFSARVDASMKVGGITETVAVTAQTPVVDTIESTRVLSIPQQELQAIPRGGGFQEIYQMAPGLSVGGKPDVGDSNLGTRSAVSTYGAYVLMSIKVEGVDIVGGAHDYSTGMYLSSYNLAEVQFKSTGQNADVAVPGFAMESIMKSGSNQFHGSFLGEWQDKKFQSNNITPELAAQGLRVTNPLERYYTYAADFGGRIVRDKLWFYGSISKQASEFGRISVVSRPNAQGCWTCGDAPPAVLWSDLPQEAVKLNYQPRRDLRLVGAYTHSAKGNNGFGASATVPLPSASPQDQTVRVWKGEAQWTATPRLVVNVLYGSAYSETRQGAQPDTPLVVGFPSATEQTTGLQTGPPSNYGQARPTRRKLLNANAVYVVGDHQFKFGTDLVLDEGRATQVKGDLVHGNYRLIFNRGLPFQIQTFNYPVTSDNSFNSQAFYAMDTWRLGRVTLNYGVRAQRFHAYYPDQSKPAGQLSPAADFQGQDVLTFKDVSPRLGATWDITGSGRTVVKGGFGVFGDHMAGEYAGEFNPNSVLTTTYRWSGPCVVTPHNNVSFNQPNTSCDVDPAYLFSLSPSSQQYVSSTGGIRLRLNPDAMKQPKIYNYTARVEHELMTNTAVSVGWVRYRINNNMYVATGVGAGGGTFTPTVFPNRPYSAYTIAVPLIDPMTGNTVNIYTYPASSVGPQFDIGEHRNAPDDRPDTYDTFEVSLTKRYSNRWNGLVSFWTTKNDKWRVPVSTDPNTDWFPQDKTRTWEARISGMVRGPWGIEVSGLYRATSGVKGQRTVRFTNALLRQGSVTIPVEEFGAQEGPVIQIANLKVARRFNLGGSRSLQLSFQAYNLFNNSSATSYSYLTGTTFGRVTGIVDPRVGRISAEFKF